MSETAKMKDVIEETIRQMDEYYDWQEDGWGPEPRKPNKETVVMALKKKQEVEVPGRIKVEVEKEDRPKPVTLGDLSVGETFSYPVGTRAENVYMVIAPKNCTGIIHKSHETCAQFVMLRSGIIYDAPITTVIRRRACSLKVAA